MHSTMRCIRHSETSFGVSKLPRVGDEYSPTYVTGVLGEPDHLGYEWIYDKTTHEQYLVLCTRDLDSYPDFRVAAVLDRYQTQYLIKHVMEDLF